MDRRRRLLVKKGGNEANNALTDLSYKQLQAKAKEAGIAANQSRETLIEMLSA